MMEMELQLALCDSACPDNKANPFTNKIGGIPDFFPSVCLSAPPTCNVCGSNLVLLVQMYCPLEGSPYHRLFHLFCCSSSSCWNNENSWLILRSQELEKSLETATPTPAYISSVSPQDWCEEADDWEEGKSDDDPIIDITTVSTTITATPQLPEPSTICTTDGLSSDLQALKLSTSNYYIAPFYPPFFINVFAESDIFYQPPVNDDGNILKDFINSVGDCEVLGKPSSATGEVYEQSMAKHGDRAFMKFKKEISKCPNQIIRYLKGGVPLSSSNHCTLPSSSIKCKTCGSSCTFEFQVMPQLVYILQESLRSSSTIAQAGPSLLAVEFSTVVVYTCDRSCWIDTDGSGSGFKEETIFVQPELETT